MRLRTALLTKSVYGAMQAMGSTCSGGSPPVLGLVDREFTSPGGGSTVPPTVVAIDGPERPDMAAIDVLWGPFMAAKTGPGDHLCNYNYNHICNYNYNHLRGHK